MRKDFDFTLQMNLSHSAALHFAKRLTKVFLFITFFITLLYISSKDFSNEKLSDSIILILEKAIEIFIIIFICLYIIGRQLPKVKQNYLAFFKRKTLKEIGNLEIKQGKIDEKVEKEIEEMKKMLGSFFRPLIKKLFKIEGSGDKENKQSEAEFKNCMDQFDQALVSAKYNLYRNVGFCIKTDLEYWIGVSLFKKERFFFDIDNWLSKFDFNSRREKIRKRIFNECIYKKIELEKTLKEIDNLVDYQFAYK